MPKRFFKKLFISSPGLSSIEAASVAAIGPVYRFDGVTLAANVRGGLDLSHKNRFLVLGIFFVLWRGKADQMDDVDPADPADPADDADEETKINDGCWRAWQRQ